MRIKDRVAVIIVNWNTYQLTRSCIVSLKNCQHNNLEIFLVDNNSIDNSAKKLKKEFKDLHYILNNENTGFCKANNQAIKKGAETLKPTEWWPYKTELAFNAMIYPITNFSIAGVIWYQGESNTINYYSYEKLFTGMIESWRKEWKINFPFYFVQIAPFKYEYKNIGALLRESQTKSSLYDNTGMVVITDLTPDTNNIHPILKKEVSNQKVNFFLGCCA